MKKSLYKVLPVAMFLLALVSCTSLEEQVLDESLTGTGQAEVVSGTIAPVYAYLHAVWTHTGNFGLQEISADEAILPYRGGTDWYDGGKYIAIHQHLTTPSNALVKDAWTYIATCLSRAVVAENRLREEVAANGNQDAQAAVYEMVAMNCYLNMLALDNWGLIFKKEDPDATSEILRGQEAVSYLEERLLSIVDVMSTSSNPGRMNKDAVRAMLANLYLNAAVYREPYAASYTFTKEDMDKVIKYTSDVISGNHTLSPEYFDLFGDNNHDNTELIFAIDNRGLLSSENQTWTYWSISGAQVPRPEFPSPSTRGTDATALTASFYQTWVDAYGSDKALESSDARFFMRNEIIPAELQKGVADGTINPTNDIDSYYTKVATEFEIDRGILRGVIWGPRKGTDGNVLKAADGKVKIYPVIKQNDKDKGLVYVNHTPVCDFTDAGSQHNAGYRFSKYQFSHSANSCCNFTNVDMVLFRLGEMYTMRAEAKLRNGDNAGALADINTLRTSRNARSAQTPKALPSIDLDILFREEGFELYWEGKRRMNQIRFGKYEESWTEKTDAKVEHRLFPIPQVAIDGASNVKGYLEQNKGY